MISVIIKDIIDPLFSDIEWIEHYGGYVVPVELSYPEGKSKTFPFSCDYAVEECKENDQYLVPHKNKLSIAYFESLDEASRIESDEVPDAFHFEQKIRFVMWYNYRKMGYDSPSRIKTALTGHILSILDELKVKNTQAPSIRLIKLEVNTDIASQDQDTSIFSKYSYFPEYKQLFKKPFDFFSIDFDFEWIIFKRCIPSVEIKPSLVC